MYTWVGVRSSQGLGYSSSSTTEAVATDHLALLASPLQLIPVAAVPLSFSLLRGLGGVDNVVEQVSVEVDTDRTWVDTLSLSLVPRNVFQRHCPLLDTSENITGTVTVQAPTSKSVSGHRSQRAPHGADPWSM